METPYALRIVIVNAKCIDCCVKLCAMWKSLYVAVALVGSLCVAAAVGLAVRSAAGTDWAAVAAALAFAGAVLALDALYDRWRSRRASM